MVRITLRKEMKNKITKVLDDNGIYTEPLPGMPSIVDLLVDALLGIDRIKMANTAERHGTQAVGNQAIDMARKRLLLSERIEAGLNIVPDLKEKAWERVMNRIINAEDSGDSFDKYVEWFKAGTQYDRPKTFQLVKNPNIIFGNWKEAQMFNSEPAPEPDKGGGIYV